MMTREQTSRAATGRELPDTQEQGVLHVPAHLVPTDMAYKWVRLSTLGEVDEANWARANHEGWTPVPSDRHPELVPPPIPGREAQSSHQVIMRAGQILMQRPIDLQRRHIQRQRMENAAVLQSVDRDRQMQGGDRNFIKEQNLHSKVTRRGGGQTIEE